MSAAADPLEPRVLLRAHVRDAAIASAQRAVRPPHLPAAAARRFIVIGAG